MNNMDLSPAVAPEPAGQVLPWYLVWALVVTQPSRDSFGRILADPNAKPARPFIWVALVGLAIGFLEAVVTQVMGVSAFSQYSAAGRISQSLCVVGSTPFFSVVGLALSTFVMRGAAKLLKGAGNRNDLVYCLGAVQAPVAIASALVSMIVTILTGSSVDSPAGARLILLPSLAIAAYAIVLYVLAVDTVEKFGIVKSVLTVLLPVMAFLAFGVCMITALGLLAAAQ